MKMSFVRSGCKAAAVAAMMLLVGTNSVSATVYNIDWLDTSAVPNQVDISSGEIFNLPGYGNVQITFTDGAGLMTNKNTISPAAQNGTHLSGGDSYSWGYLGTFNRVNVDDTGTMNSYSVTYTFLNGPMPAGELALSVYGLGRIDLNIPGNITTAGVSQNGTFLGDHNVGIFGATEYTGGAGSFSMRNALPGDLTPGNPAFNSQLGIVRIDDSVSSLTINMAQIGQDGIGMTIGRIAIPAPTTALVGLVGLVALRRRRN